LLELKRLMLCGQQAAGNCYKASDRGSEHPSAGTWEGGAREAAPDSRQLAAG
jgi:hypothetical protein